MIPVKMIMDENQHKPWELCCKPISEQEKVDMLNAKEGKLDKSIYYCEKCKNKGLIYFLETVNYKGKEHLIEKARECECKTIRSNIKNMKKSGLEPIIKKCTFDKYETKEKWQKKAKEAAQNFVKNVNDLEKKCFFIGGGVGSGKTHLCTAIVREFLKTGETAKYMLWVDESRKLKSIVNETSYDTELDKYKKVKILYIDDFFRNPRDSQGKELLSPTGADIRLAYEIINYRYQHDELITIISSERFINEIEEIDSAVGSRIYEMSQGYSLGIAREKSRNYRLRNMEVL